MKKFRSTLAAVAAGTLCVVLVLGIPLSASAYSWHTYWNGKTFQNQTISSATTSMNGGHAIDVVIATYARITQVGIGSIDGASLAEVTHPTVVTYSYCQWRSASNHGHIKYTIICEYRT
jgi:hypothetical protein